MKQPYNISHLENTSEHRTALSLATRRSYWYDFPTTIWHVVTKINDMLAEGKLDYSTADGQTVAVFSDHQDIKNFFGIEPDDMSRQPSCMAFEEKLSRLYKERLEPHDAWFLTTRREFFKTLLQHHGIDAWAWEEISMNVIRSKIETLSKIDSAIFTESIIKDMWDEILFDGGCDLYWNDLSDEEKKWINLSKKQLEKFIDSTIYQLVDRPEHDRRTPVMGIITSQIMSLMRISWKYIQSLWSVRDTTRQRYSHYLIQKEKT